MKPSMQLQLGHQLTMTPQLQQAIRLLQLSSLDLQTEIQEALESNLMLERADEAEATEMESESPEPVSGGTELEGEIPPETAPIPEELPIDSEWSDHFEGYTPTGSSSGPDTESLDPYAQKSRPETLRDHLLWQLNLSPLEGRDFTIALALIDAIDPDGYLRQRCEEVQAVLDDPEVRVQDVERVLRVVQAFDPPGVGARDAAECLVLQLRQLPDEEPAKRDAIALCTHCFRALGRNDTARIQRQLGLSPEAIQAAIALIRTLNPYPGRQIAHEEPEYVIPDVFVHKRGDRWVVELNPDLVPKLRINAEYAKLIRRADPSEDNACLRTHLQEARWFIKSLMSRNETVLRVATKIVEFQRDFFERGEEAMRPLVLREVAEALDLHESTVSRVTTRKYMLTPRGTYEFKFFFSSHLSTTTGGECSSTAIRARIRTLIAEEPPKKPLSDQRIAGLLAEEGIRIARRTIAKYREAMGIPPSNERKRLA